MRRTCEAGACSADCGDGCGCISWGEGHENCFCRCYPGNYMIVKGGRKILFKTFKPRIKVTSETKFTICIHDLPISEIARFLDKFLPNKIFIPLNGATNRVTLYLKNKTLRQITNASGLALKS